jgi:hypothetical protein
VVALPAALRAAVSRPVARRTACTRNMIVSARRLEHAEGVVLAGVPQVMTGLAVDLDAGGDPVGSQGRCKVARRGA